MKKKTDEQIKKEMKDFEDIVRPVIKYLNNPKLFHPHTVVTIDCCSAQLLEQKIGITNKEYLLD